MSLRRGKAGSRARRRHSVGVCSACRRRHIKCDLVRPICGGCRAIGSACEIVDSDLIWHTTTGSFQEKNRRRSSTPLAPRRHLYTDQDRVSMIIDLQSSLQTRSVNDSLQEIDDGSEEASLYPGQSSFIGPFGILSLQKAEASPASNDQGEADALPTLDSPSAIELDILPTDLTDISSHLQNVEEFLDWPDLFDIDLSWSDLSFDDISTAPSQFPPAPDMGNTAEQESGTFVIMASSENVNLNPSDFSLGNVQIQEAQMLLRRYKDIVVAHSFSFPLYGTSPWESLNIDAAVITMGRISFMGIDRVSDAAMSNLLALLAVSSAHKAAEIRNQGIQGAEHWEKISMESYTRGKDHLQRSLKSEANANPPPKYKEQMMAISAMLSFAILLDRQEEARAYLIDSERLLRIRGLTKPSFSRKARQLHHIYTWNRILGESTYVFRVHGKDPHPTKRPSGPLRKRPAQQRGEEASSYFPNPSNTNIQLDDFLRLSDDTPDCGVPGEKEQGDVLNAMHIEESRTGSKAFYRQLYGVSETWLSLVSQTTRLANTIDKLKASKSSQDHHTLPCIENTKLQLEEMIWKLISYDEPPQSFLTNSNSPNSSSHPRAYMVHALNLGLLIFFYRRIRESNPRLLQPYVTSIIQALREFKASCDAHRLEGPGSPWPAFMAGCEAMSPHDREYLSNWMEEAFLATGFARFKTIKQCMQQVWIKQRESSDRKATTYHSWVDTCREHNIYVLLS